MAEKPTVYAIQVTHYPNGMIEIEIIGVGDSDEDKEAIIYALEHAIDLLGGYESETVHVH